MNFKGHTGKIYQMKITRNGKHLASIGQDDFAIIWNAKTSQKSDALILENSFVLSLGFSPSGRLLACGGLENSCDVYVVNNEENNSNNNNNSGNRRTSAGLQPRLPISTFKGHRGFISQLDFLSENHAITASGDMSIGIWDTQTSERIIEYGYGDHLGVINTVVPHPFDERIFVSASSDKMVKIWDIRERRSQQTFSDHNGDITCAQFFPDGNAVISSADDGTIRLFDLRSDCQLAVVNVDKNSSPVTSICFTPSGRTLVVGYEDGVCGSLDVLKGNWVSQLVGHRDLISSVCVAEEGRLYTSSWDGTIKSWEPIG